MRSRCSARLLRDELGTVTAELVAAIPAVLMVLALVVGGVAAASVQVRLEAAAGHAARALARGESADGLLSGATLSQEARGELVCASVSESALFGALQLSATSCADAAGR